jgi:hypothetical protein
MRKVLYLLLVLCLVTGCSLQKEVVIDNDESKEVVEQEDTSTGYIVDSIDIKKIDDSNYEFVYRDETFKVYYMTDLWKIYDSYKITNSSDIKKICKALIDIHPIHGADMKSYRNEIDMMYEWVQHNLAYQILPEGNSFRNSAKDVDLDPKDQGKSLVEMYEDRTGQKMDLGDFFK